jgi:hypothetical protein
MSHLRVVSTQDNKKRFSRVTIGVIMIDLDLYSVKGIVNCLDYVIYTVDLVTFLEEAALLSLY